MRRTKRSKKRSNNNTSKASVSVEIIYSPELAPPPPPPSVPVADKQQSGSPIAISSQKDLEILVDNVKRINSPSSSPLSTPPVEKASKRKAAKKFSLPRSNVEQEAKTKQVERKKRKTEDEKDEDYVETGERSEDEEDSDFDDNVESSGVDERGTEDDVEEELEDGSENDTKRGREKGRTAAGGKLPQAVRNRIAAQEFRQRQKTYVLGLEQRVDTLVRMNTNVCCRLRVLVRENSLLRYHLAFLRDFISKVSVQHPLPPPTTTAQTKTEVGKADSATDKTNIK